MSCSWCAQYAACSSTRVPRPKASDMWTFVSTNPGVTNFPLPSMTSAPSGTATEARSPTAEIRSPSITIVPSAMRAPPFPSMIVAPMIARGVRASGPPAGNL